MVLVTIVQAFTPRSARLGWGLFPLVLVTLRRFVRLTLTREIWGPFFDPQGEVT